MAVRTRSGRRSGATPLNGGADNAPGGDAAAAAPPAAAGAAETPGGGALGPGSPVKAALAGKSSVRDVGGDDGAARPRRRSSSAASRAQAQRHEQARVAAQVATLKLTVTEAIRAKEALAQARPARRRVESLLGAEIVAPAPSWGAAAAAACAGVAVGWLAARRR